MRIVRTVFLSGVLVLIGGAFAWFARGEYDKHFMMEGHFHIVSRADQDHEVVLKFPSGKQVDFNLKKNGSVDFVITDTGEGSITVIVDGRVRDQVGYVTSMNSIVVLIIDEDHTGFSQIFPSLYTEQGAAADAGKRRH